MYCKVPSKLISPHCERISEFMSLSSNCLATKRNCNLSISSHFTTNFDPYYLFFEILIIKPLGHGFEKHKTNLFSKFEIKYEKQKHIVTFQDTHQGCLQLFL